MSRRTVVTILILAAVAAGAYYLTYWQQARRTTELLNVLTEQAPKPAADAMEQLRAQGTNLYPRLVGMTRHQASWVRWRSAVLLGELDDPHAGEALVPLLKDSDATVRAAAAQALGRLRVEEAVPSLGVLVADEEEELAVRIGAARALMLLAPAAALSQLTEALTYVELGAAAGAEEDASWPLRAEAAGALGAVATPEAVTALAIRVSPDEEPDARVRAAVAYALGDAALKVQHDPDQLAAVMETLLQAADDEIGDVRVAAVHALGLVRPPDSQTKRVKQVVEKARHDEHYWVRQAAEAGR